MRIEGEIFQMYVLTLCSVVNFKIKFIALVFFQQMADLDMPAMQQDADVCSCGRLISGAPTIHWFLRSTFEIKECILIH